MEFKSKASRFYVWLVNMGVNVLITNAGTQPTCYTVGFCEIRLELAQV